MPVPYNPLVPHKNLIKCLYLAGIPLMPRERYDNSIVDIMREYEYKPFETETYEDIFAEMDEVLGARAMATKNAIINEKNRTRKIREGHEPLVIDENVMKTFQYPLVGIDIMNAFSRNGEKLSKLGTKTIRILGNITERQNIEVLLMKDQKYIRIVEILNESPNGRKLASVDQIAAYSHYFWNFRLIGADGITMSEFANYIAIKSKSNFYDVHANLCYLRIDETLASMGYLGEDVRSSINKTIFGLATNMLIESMRTGARVKDYVYKIYQYSDASIAEDKKMSNNEDIREQLAAVFKNIEGVKEKRLSMSDLKRKREEEEPEQDEPAVVRR